jgi:hypothetical protein
MMLAALVAVGCDGAMTEQRDAGMEVGPPEAAAEHRPSIVRSAHWIRTSGDCPDVSTALVAIEIKDLSMPCDSALSRYVPLSVCVDDAATTACSFDGTTIRESVTCPGKCAGEYTVSIETE